ncbi:MAG: translation initiation factor IF-2 [Thermoanaerobaculia bacterium]
MAKISVKELAKRMGIPNQDLMFKLKSIGVRVDEENADLDASVLQAILAGKKLPHPREVILRDEEAQASAPRPGTARRPGAHRRLAPNPLRPQRRRTIIQKVEPRIKTIPVTERTREEREAEAAAAKAADEAAAQRAAEAEAAAAAEKVEAEEKAATAKPAKSKRVAAEEAEDAASSRSRRRAERKEAEAEAEGPAFKEGQAPGAPVTITEGMTVRAFAEKLGVKSRDLMKQLFDRGLMATINDVVEPAVAEAIAAELGVEALTVTFEEEIQIQEELGAESTGERRPRAPVITVMGHVDHGKTTLLDRIRSTRVAEGEHGGITQHIGAYQVDSNGKKLVFLDTPGHEAFTLMRARGASVTDVVVLVVAADDGVMPQTLEAIDHARAAEVPIVVAINKIDKDNANPDRVKKELADRGLMVEDWGGDVVSVPISALKGEGIDDLLENLLVVVELLELDASPSLSAQGVVLEARKEVGRGIIATVLVQDGTLHKGDAYVAGATWGRVRSMTDDRGERIQEAGPSTPVEVTGFDDLPGAGDLIQVLEDESKARSIAEFRQQEKRQRELNKTPSKVSLEQLFESIEEGEVKELPVVLKGDVQGSVEVLGDTLTKLSTDKVRVKVIHAAVGAITTNDVLLASASEAIVVGFNVRPERNAAELAEKEEVDIRLHTVIYELADELTQAMTGLLEPTYREVEKGRAEVREVFKIPKVGKVAGSHVVEGVIPRTAKVRLMRDNVVVHEGAISSLRRFKEDVSEVRSGFDCGIRLDSFQDVKPGDVIEAYVREEVAPSL